MKLGVEIGGTFTDFILMCDGEIVKTFKVPSTPGHPETAVLDGVEKLGVELKMLELILHGSTVATNAVLERKGANTGLITTRGFRDILEIYPEERETVYDLRYRKPAPLVSRDKVTEVTERVAPDGTVVTEMVDEDVRGAINYLISEKAVDSIAVSFIHSYANPRHEQRVKQILDSLGITDLYVTLSSEILPEFREFPRASTAVINAYVQPVVDKYIARLEKELWERNFRGRLHIFQSNGGIIPTSGARRHAVRVLFSGPAAGVVGATHAGKLSGRENLISLDMGGTSTDVCLIKDGVPQVSTESTIDGLPVRVPMVNIVSIGAGGGSIAWIDSGGMLHVGPESAGADPGPACYGKGGSRPTITDAYVVLGLIRPENFVGGNMRLHPDAASEAISKLAKRLGLGLTETAEAIYRVANASMAQAIRLVSVEKGYDPRDYVLVPFGGAGPLHAACLAEEVEIKEVLVPRYPGLLSAYGLLLADFKWDYVQTEVKYLGDDDDADRIVAVFDTLMNRADDELSQYKEVATGRYYVTSLDMRYEGQSFELNVPVDLAELKQKGSGIIRKAFDDLHQQRYGHYCPNEDVQIINYRLLVGCPQTASAKKQAGPEVPAGLPVQRENGRIFMDGRETECVFVNRDSLPARAQLKGPMVVEEYTSTTFVPSGWYVTVEPCGNLILRREESR